MMITSKDNPHIRFAASLLTKKGREKTDRFLVEGVKLVSEALACPELVETVFVAEDQCCPRAKDGCDFTGPTFEIAASLSKILSDTETPQGVWAVCRKTAVERPLPPDAGFLLVLAGIQDPGNVGTMIRTAWAAGIDGVILTRGSADPYNPKTIRAAMGATLFLPLYTNASAEDLRGLKESGGYQVIAAALDEKASLFDTRFGGKIMIVLGSEGQGIPTDILALSDQSVTIPLRSGVDSLNAAVACGIILYEAYRQRDPKK